MTSPGRCYHFCIYGEQGNNKIWNQKAELNSRESVHFLREKKKILWDQIILFFFKYHIEFCIERCYLYQEMHVAETGNKFTLGYEFIG